MRSAFIRIAIAKTAEPDAVSSLQRIEALIKHHEAGERSFAERINASKSERGEPSVKLRKAQRDMLTSLHEDQLACDEAVMAQLQDLETAQEIIQALHAGLSMGLDSDEKLLERYHPADRPIGADMLARKKAVILALGQFLTDHPRPV